MTRRDQVESVGRVALMTDHLIATVDRRLNLATSLSRSFCGSDARTGQSMTPLCR